MRGGRILARGKATSSSAAASASASKSAKTRATTGANATDEQTLQSIVLPPRNDHSDVKLNGEQRRWVDAAASAHQRHATDTAAMLDRMHAKMAAACRELERTDPRLFRLAMRRTLGEYMPVERRLPVDQAPAGGWNHAHRLDTRANSSQQQQQSVASKQ